MKKNYINKIYFVGAGPGAVDLITVRGMKLIEKADVIIYAGSLVNPELLKYNTRNAEIHNSARMTLDEVTKIMIEAYCDAKLVVRLHTGDPSIYGAIKEQMDILDKNCIPYETCPGVSAAFGAASSLNLEYTLPDISQTLILTRMEGKTSVPKSESIESLAAHKASMAIYLSTGMLEELSERLILGGYEKDTPAAIIYKATWPEEIIIRTCVSELAEQAKKAGITKTAIALVGYALSGHDYSKSRLYASDFSTEFRKGRANTKIVCFTDNGIILAKKIASFIDNSSIYVKKQDINECTDYTVMHESIYDWVRSNFTTGDYLIFVGACGIAVRAIAGQVCNKLLDPAVIVVDEHANHVIPLLSGHYGGANELALLIAEKLDADPVITTATDLNNCFSIDLFAKENNLEISDRKVIKQVNSYALKNKPIVLKVINKNSTESSDAYIKGNVSFASGLYSIGIGCKRGISAQRIEEVVEMALEKADISIKDIGVVSSIDVKSDEEGILEFAKKHMLPFVCFDAQSLMELKGEFTKSEFVLERVGVDNVCERSAIAAAGVNSKLILQKYSNNGVTVAIAK